MSERRLTLAKVDATVAQGLLELELKDLRRIKKLATEFLQMGIDDDDYSDKAYELQLAIDDCHEAE